MASLWFSLFALYRVLFALLEGDTPETPATPEEPQYITRKEFDEWKKAHETKQTSEKEKEPEPEPEPEPPKTHRSIANPDPPLTIVEVEQETREIDETPASPEPPVEPGNPPALPQNAQRRGVLGAFRMGIRSK